jgi:hypothetical protein
VVLARNFLQVLVVFKLLVKGARLMKVSFPILLRENGCAQYFVLKKVNNVFMFLQ